MSNTASTKTTTAAEIGRMIQKAAKARNRTSDRALWLRLQLAVERLTGALLDAQEVA